MAGDVGLRHRETHIGEEPSLAACPDVTFSLDVRLRRRRSDGVDPELLGQCLQLGLGHPTPRYQCSGSRIWRP